MPRVCRKELRSVTLRDPAQPQPQYVQYDAARFSGDGKNLTTIFRDYQRGGAFLLMRWDAETGKPEKQHGFTEAAPTSCQLSPDGQTVLVIAAVPDHFSGLLKLFYQFRRCILLFSNHRIVAARKH